MNTKINSLDDFNTYLSRLENGPKKGYATEEFIRNKFKFEKACHRDDGWYFWQGTTLLTMETKFCTKKNKKSLTAKQIHLRNDGNLFFDIMFLCSYDEENSRSEWYLLPGSFVGPKVREKKHQKRPTHEGANHYDVNFKINEIEPHKFDIDSVSKVEDLNIDKKEFVNHILYNK